MSEKYYVTTAIDYGNASPHVGHAYEKVCADCAARWHRIRGRRVFFLTGTDENAQKVCSAARERGVTPKELVDATSKQFRRLCEVLNVSNDRFIRTTDEDHFRAVQHVFRKLVESGDIYRGHYEGLYCRGCEAFYAPEDLDDGVCRVHGTRCETIKEENYFFRMSKYQEALLEHFEKHPDFMIPDYRVDEVLNRVKVGLQDLSVSRATSQWGIPVPGDPSQVVYVWLDALVNYLTGVGYPDGDYRSLWPADAHFIGKDIIWFHAVIWPCVLMAIGEELPRHLCVHGFWHVGEEKMSKSRGNVVDPFDLVEKYGVDAVRYFLLRETSFGQDGEFSEEALAARRKTELANELGNLVQRVQGMVMRYLEGRVGAVCSCTEDVDADLRKVAEEMPARVADAMEEYRFSVALEEIWSLVRRANRYVEETAPWLLAREGKKKRLEEVLYNLLEVTRLLSVVLYPFLPSTAASMRSRLGLDCEVWSFEETSVWGVLREGTSIKPGGPLFPPLEEE